jgi:hypothetical protein
MSKTVMEPEGLQMTSQYDAYAFQTSRGAHPVCHSNWCRGPFPRVKHQDVKFTTHPHPMPKLRAKRAIPLPLLYALMTSKGTTSPFAFASL